LKILKPLTLALIIALFSCNNKDNYTEEYTSIITDELNSEDQILFNLIREKDSLLFQIGFNQIDTLQVVKLTSTDFEFYHDEHGITETKSAFVSNIDGIRELPFKTWRTLVDGSMEVFPLYKDNSQVLYGAIQIGVHDFYQQNEGEDARKTNTARFTHLWIIENGDWKLKRVLSYDHQVPK
jgi:hypothetical protein|tara:strand:+ start:71 stop:613 length:543 start_codon:yes stop_codon:yes gene_type:complete